MFNNRILRILTQKCSPCKNSRQITANAKIHGKRQNSRLSWISWIRDFRLALGIVQNETIHYEVTISKWTELRFLYQLAPVSTSPGLPYSFHCGCAVSQAVIKGWPAISMGEPKIWPPVYPKPLNFPHQNLHRWLSLAYLLMCKIWWKSVHGGLPHE